MSNRRRLLAALPLAGAAVGFARARAAEPAPPKTEPKAERFPGDPPEHKIVYQINRADNEYIEAILNSIGAMITKYQDNVAIAAVVFGPAIHLVAREPRRPIAAPLRQRVVSQTRDYGVRFIACANTMKTLGWTAKDLVDGVAVEGVGAATLMELQEQGYAYVAW